MATAFKWGIEDHQLVTEEGVVTSGTFVFRTDDLDNDYADLRTLQEALSATGLPQHGDAAPGNPNLRMFRQSVQPVAGCPTSARVVCEYKTVADWEDSFILSIAGGLNSTQTNTDIHGNIITLNYTYPADYTIEDLQNQPLESAMNETVYEPRVSLTGTGSLYVYYPLPVVQSWLWHMNSTAWAGWPAGYWLCTGCDATARVLGVGMAPLWRFRWTFELNVRGWPVVAKIVDPNKGIIPPDVVPGVGIKPVDWYPSRNFNDIFGNT